jgi:uncharacterized metal-binding protein YceD (DUF177 family)
MMPMPGYRRPMAVDTLGPTARTVRLDADEAERAAIAERLDLVAVRSLEAELAIGRKGRTVSVAGTVRAAVTQSCVASGEPVEAMVEEAFRVELRPRLQDGGTDDEIELGEGELDVDFYDGASVDLAEVVAQSLALALDPYPRSAWAEEALRQAGVKGEGEAAVESSPFAGLAALKDKLKP